MLQAWTFPSTALRKLSSRLHLGIVKKRGVIHHLSRGHVLCSVGRCTESAPPRVWDWTHPSQALRRLCSRVHMGIVLKPARIQFLYCGSDFHTGSSTNFPHFGSGSIGQLAHERRFLALRLKSRRQQCSNNDVSLPTLGASITVTIIMVPYS